MQNVGVLMTILLFFVMGALVESFINKTIPKTED
jgi:hypothetical protein